MLKLSSDYYDRAILSLRTGSSVGMAHTPIINPNNLKIEGWFATNLRDKSEYILPIGEIRDFINKGVVVDDHTALTEPEDIIRLKDVIQLRFELTGKQVLSESGKKLGKVSDFAVDDLSHHVKKLYVNPPLLKGFTSGQLIIDRLSIIEITNKKIVVQDATEKIKSGSRSPAGANA